MNERPRFAIVGVGGIGGIFATKLVQAGEEVVLIARGEHLKAIQASGLKLVTPQGEIVSRPSLATGDPAQAGTADFVLVTTKTDGLTAALEAARPMVGPKTAVITTQNGLTAPEQAAAVFGEERVVGGTVFSGGYVAGPGVVSIIGQSDILAIKLGEWRGGISPRIERLVETLRRAKLPVEAVPDIRTELWVKFGAIAISAVGAVSRSPYGVWRSLPGTRAMAEAILGEIEAVARARGITLPSDFAPRHMALADGLPATFTSSTQRDIAGGRPSEMEEICGVLPRLGREVGVPTPVSDFIYHALLPQEMKARGLL